jgi:hypothetical protein
MEIWKDIPGYKTLYQVSNLGNVKTLEKVVLRNNKYPFVSKEKKLKQRISRTGYSLTTLIKDKKAITHSTHKLVCMAFLNHKPCGHKLVVNHINRIRTDNRLENLELITQRQNCFFKTEKSTSKYVGVYLRNDNNKWSAQITTNGKQKTLGSFLNEIDAHYAYQNAILNL